MLGPYRGMRDGRWGSTWKDSRTEGEPAIRGIEEFVSSLQYIVSEVGMNRLGSLTA